MRRLAFSEESLQAILEQWFSVDLPMLHVDSNGIILHSNDASRAMLGMTEGVGVRLLDFLVSQDRPFLEAGLRTSGNHFRVECRFERCGESRLGTVAGLSLGEGQWLLELFDITTFRRAQQKNAALYQANLQLNRADWEIELDPPRLVMSPAMIRLATGQEAKESAVLALPLEGRKLVHPQDRTRIRQLLGSAIQTLSPFETEFRVVHGGGSVRWLHIVGTVLTNLRGAPWVVGMAEDTTDKRRGTEDRLQMQKLQSLGALAGGIAHDFNNQLAVVLGHISLARQAMKGIDDNPDELLDVAEAACLRAKDLASQLMHLGREDRPRVTEAIDMEALLHTAEQVLTGYPVEIVYEPTGTCASVRGDPGQLLQVLQNLLLNAAQAMSEGGTIRIAVGDYAAAAEEELLQPGRYVLISVADTGPGVPESLRERIFDPYFTTKDDGHGLGLASAYAIARRHGGLLRLDRAEHGATFHLLLPAAS